MEQKQRLRAQSKRSLETKAKILDAAEQVFSTHGFDGATIRKIATLAGVQVALVHHHGGGKAELFNIVVERRAKELAQLRLDALADRKVQDDPDLRAVLRCFIEPFLDKVFHGGPTWRAYGRLIAHVSSDERWRSITETYFDPTVKVFLDEIETILPGVSRASLGSCFVFMVSSMLSICASRWRIDTLSQENDQSDLVEDLLQFCEAGFLQLSRQ